MEPTPVSGKNGFVDLSVQAAYDATNLYLRFDGKDWKVWGFPKLDKVVQEGKQPAICEDRMSVLIDDGKVPGFAQQGCWLTCQVGSRDMPKAATKEDAAANPLLAAIKKGDLRKYLPARPAPTPPTGRRASRWTRSPSSRRTAGSWT